MKYFTVFILIIVFINTGYSQIYDINKDGIFDNYDFYSSSYDYEGNGIMGTIHMFFHKDNPSTSHCFPSLYFSEFWNSTSGMFSNCWDGQIGHFDGDTLIDIAGYTFSPNKFYIYEQSPYKPDSFALVFEYTKTDAGGFGPITFGDTDNDEKIEIILADLSTMTRIFIFENEGNNNYINLGTQTTLTHTNNGQNGRSIYITDLNKNGKKEIILSRGSTDGGMVRLWEHTGTPGTNTYSNIYTYTTVTYLFGQGGLGDSDNDGFDEIFLSYGAGAPSFPTYIRRIEFDSVSSSFIHLQHTATSTGTAASYQIKDINNDGIKELIHTGNSNGRAAIYFHRSTGPLTYTTIDSVFETADNNSILTSDIKHLYAKIYPSILLGSFNGKVYVYEYNGTQFIKQFEKTDYNTGAIRRVKWLTVTNRDAFFNTSSSSSSNGTFYIFRRDLQVSITPLIETNNSFFLYDNYPNPFNPSTVLKYRISKASFVKMSILDITGKELNILFKHYLQPGEYIYTFTADHLPSGIYFYRLASKEKSVIKKMVLVK